MPPGKLHPRRVAIDASLFSGSWCRPCGRRTKPPSGSRPRRLAPKPDVCPWHLSCPRKPSVPSRVHRNSKALFASSGAHPLEPSSALVAGYPVPRILPRGAAWLWLVLDRRRRRGEGRAAWVPWGEGPGRTVVEGWGGIDANGRQRGEQRGEPHLRCTHVTHEATHGRGRGLRDGAKITPRFAFIAGVPSSSTVAEAFQRNDPSKG